MPTNTPKTSPETPYQAALIEVVNKHPIWNNPLLSACKKGHLSREDLTWFFGQYAHYSQSFTRGLAGCMANMHDDYWRALLTENLWEESGEKALENRHSEIFKRFLEHLDSKHKSAKLAPETKLFVIEWLEACKQSDSLCAVAHLSLGTEYIVSRLYKSLLAGLKAAGVDDEHLLFFRIHIECDDAHAETLLTMLLAQIHSDHDLQRVKHAINAALNSRDQFFSSLYERIQWRRVRPKVHNIQNKRSLVGDMPSLERHHFSQQQRGIVAYSNHSEKLGINFSVQHLPFSSETLDTRIVEIAPQSTNERHKHAHETIYHLIEGQGEVSLNERKVPVKAGDIVFIPRWALHQAVNRGDGILKILTVTDYSLTGKAFIGNYLKTARMDKGLSQISSGALRTSSSPKSEGREQFAIPLLQDSLNTLLEKDPKLAQTLLYDLKSYPGDLNLPLSDSNIQQIAPIFQQALLSLVDHLEDGPWMIQTLRSLGKQLSHLNMSQDTYKKVESSLLCSFKRVYAEQWKDEFTNPWSYFFQDAASIMMDAQKTHKSLS